MKRSRAGLYLLAAVWNFTIGVVLYVLGVHRVAPFMWVGVVASLGFLAMAVRAATLTTYLIFERGRFFVRPGPLAFWLRFEAPIADIAGFEVVHCEDQAYEVFVLSPGGARRKLPIDLEGTGLIVRGSGRRLLVAPRSHADFVAARLGQMLEDARRSGHDTYRS